MNSLSPANGTVLTAGESVTFTATVTTTAGNPTGEARIVPAIPAHTRLICCNLLKNFGVGDLILSIVFMI